MLPLSHHVIRYGALQGSTLCARASRSISLTSAIEKGIRHAQRGRVRLEARHAKARNDTYAEEQENASLEDTSSEDQRAGTEQREAVISGLERRSGQKTRRGPRTMTPGDLAEREKRAKRKRDDFGIPTSLPFTTAGSEFLYGTFAVLSALKAQRRKLYKIYRLLPPGYGVDTNRARAMQPKQTADEVRLHNQINSLAEAAGLNVEAVSGPRWTGIFSKASDGRPHNGWIVEASSVPKLPVTTLSALQSPSDPIIASVGWESEEEKAVNTVWRVAGSKATVPSVRPAHRFPFMLLLDCITDTGNFGAIVRSAWFLGVDAILILEHGTAPITGNSVKASAGAFEFMPVLHVRNEREFVKTSRRNGWKFFAADAPETVDVRMRRMMQQGFTEPLPVEGALLRHPCVLVLGNEDTGIRDFFRTMVDGVAGIPNSRPHVKEIDSLNVSVAAAVLTEKFFDSALEDPTTSDEAAADS